jgi:class 3 adenylate cyclase/tetratricopeptide (TPR) repeat protein
MEVADWLRGLNLSQYEAVFRDNEIDWEVLPDLNEFDLEKLGVPMGHRKKMLRAIAKLAAPLQEPPPSPATPHAVVAGEGERRQLTLMFCDLVGSTALAVRLDPEDFVELIRDSQAAVSEATAKFDGLVAKWMGDGALIYFGYPHAHEDDAERAVRAGLTLAPAVRRLRDPKAVAMEVRVGIATGLVVVGEVTGEGEARERGVVGETPNLAARLQALAQPGNVVVSESTRRLLGGTFELEALGPQPIRGLAAPVFAWVVRRENMSVNRFEASLTKAMTPFVGREQEVALLVERWRDAKEGEGQVVLLSGEAGIGKSRILANLRLHIGEENHIAMSFQCSAHHVNEAFYPVLGPIWRAAGFESDEPAEQRLDKLEAFIGRAGLANSEFAPVLAALFSIPTVKRYPAFDMAPSEAKQRTIDALMALFEGLTTHAPVLTLVEDAHWIDPSSLDLFGRLVERAPALRVLLLISFRSEFSPPWIGGPNVTAHRLNRLGRRHSLEMIQRLTAGKPLPDEVLEQIVAKTDGVPLFVEELTKTVLESDLLREEAGGYVLRAALSPLAIPSTLQDSLMSRLDRLAAVRDIAQIGAAIGREFSHRLIEAVAPISGAALQIALDQLVASELIYRRGEPPDVTYVFKHALVQDTAYGSLLRGRRQAIHADIARALCERFADTVESAPALIAHHFTEAGLREPAARYWLKATEQALSHSAYREANRYVDSGLQQLPALEDRPHRQSLELALQLARANAVLPLRGYDAPETLTALGEAKRLLDSGVGDDLQRFSVLYGLCAANFFAARLEPAHALARQIVEFAEKQEDATYKLVGHRLLGTTLVLMGRNREALEYLERAEAYRDPSRHRLLSYRFANDPGLAILCYKIWTLSALGRYDDAAEVAEQVQAELIDHPHAPTVAFCNFFSFVFPLHIYNDYEGCEYRCNELVAYCEENKVEQFRLLGILYRSLARAAREPNLDHVAEARAALGAMHRFGGHIGDSSYISWLAEVSLMAGDLAGAHSEIAECLAFIEKSGERHQLADVRRIEGRIALAGPTPDRARAEECFRLAIESAREQAVPIYELRASTELARLWRDSRPAAELRAMLEPLISALQGGAETPDMRNASAFLTELG